MNKILPIFYHLGRLVLAIVFIYAGWVKARDPLGFAGQVGQYRILPYAWNVLVAATLPSLELLCGALLLLNQKVRPALFVLTCLNLLFILLLGSALARGLDIDCGCFDPNAVTKAGLLMALWRDLGLLLLMLGCWWLRSRRYSEPGEVESE